MVAANVKQEWIRVCGSGQEAREDQGPGLGIFLDPRLWLCHRGYCAGSFGHNPTYWAHPTPS